LVRGNWGRSKTSCPWASRASSVLGSSVPGIGGSRKGAGSTLAMATASKGARAGVKGSQPRADERERFRAFERDSSKVECTLVRESAAAFAGSHTNADLGGSVERVGFRPRAHPGHDSGCTSKESRRGLRAPKALAAFARSLSAFASLRCRKVAVGGVTLTARERDAHFSRSTFALARERRTARGRRGLGPGGEERG